MKLKVAVVVLSVFSVFTCINAGMHQMEADLKALVEMKQTEMGSNSRNLTRGFSGYVVTLLNQIWGYGCWCYFQDDFGKGVGEPVNEIDAYR